MVANRLSDAEVKYSPTSLWAGVIQFDLTDPELGPTTSEMKAKYCSICPLYYSHLNLTCNGYGSAGTTDGANLSSAEPVSEAYLMNLARCFQK